MAQQADNILEIKDELKLAVNGMRYCLDNIDRLNADHSTMHAVMERINNLYLQYINAKINYTNNL